MSLYLASGGRLGERPPASASAEAGSSTFVSDPAIPVVDPYGATEGARDIAC